jgi:hypothetical protein
LIPLIVGDIRVGRVAAVDAFEVADRIRAGTAEGGFILREECISRVRKVDSKQKLEWGVGVERKKASPRQSLGSYRVTQTKARGELRKAACPAASITCLFPVPLTPTPAMLAQK